MQSINCFDTEVGKGRGKKPLSLFSPREKRSMPQEKKGEEAVFVHWFFVDYTPVWPGTGHVAVVDSELLIVLFPSPKHEGRECGMHCHSLFLAALGIGPRASWMTGKPSAN